MSGPFPLGRVQDHDPRSLAYPAKVTGVTVATKTWRRYGTVLDQGQVGSCTGNATAHSLNSKPFHAVGATCYKEPDALRFYSLATQYDSYPGTYPPDDQGSSGLGAAKGIQSLGLITSYQWAFGFDHFLTAAMLGPLIVGTDWYEDMFNPDSVGVVHPTGALAGGHEYVLNGVNVTSKMLRFQNSWSSAWGVYGHFYMSFADFTTLLTAGGDAVLFVK